MPLEVYTIREAKKWDEIVKSFKDYDVYWLSGYVKAFELHGDGKPLLFYYHDKNTRGINVAMKRNIEIYTPDDQSYYDFSTPYGYGGWLIEGNDIEGLLSEYEKWIKANNVVSEFIRFHPLIKNHTKLTAIYDVVELGQVIHMDLASEKTVWDNITSKNRNMIRKAIKNGIVIRQSNTRSAYQNFKVIYDKTMDRDRADDYYYFDDAFYESLQNDLKDNSTVFIAERNKIAIAAAIILSSNGRLNYHLSGSVKEYGSLAPTNLLLYEVAILGSKKGYKSLYLGGGVGSKEDGLLKFKKSFNRNNANHFYIGKKIWNEKKYAELCELVDSSNNYFPAYRSKK